MSHSLRFGGVCKSAANCAAMQQHLAGAAQKQASVPSYINVNPQSNGNPKGQVRAHSSWMIKDHGTSLLGIWDSHRAGLCSAQPPEGSEGEFVDFRVMEKWEEVRDKVKELGSSITPPQIGAAFGCLKKIRAKGATIPKEFMMEMSSVVIGLDKSLHAREVGDVLHACGKLKFAHVGLLEHIAGLVVNDKQPSIDSFDARTLATLTHALGSHKNLMSMEDFQRGQISAFVKQAVDRLSDPAFPVWEARSAVQVLYGLSLLKHNDDALCKRLLATFMDPQTLESSYERELFSIAYSMAALKIHHPELLKLIVSEVCKSNRRAVASKFGIAAFIHSICRLGFREFKTVGDLVDIAISGSAGEKLLPLDLAQMITGMGALGMVGHPVLERVGKKCADAKMLRAFSDQELANLVHGFAKLKYMSPELEEKIIREVKKKKRVTSFSDQHLSNILYGLSRLQIGDLDCKVKLVGEAVRKKRLSSFTAQGLSNVLFSLRQWKYEGEELHALMKEITKAERLEAYDTHTLSSILYSLSQMKYSNLQILGLVVEECVRPRKIVTFKAQGIANIIVSVSQIGIKDDVVWQILAMEATKPSRLTCFTEQGLIQILYALRNIKLQNDELMAAIGREVLVPERLGDYSHESLAGAFVTLAEADFSWRWMDNRSKANVLNEVSKPTRLRGFSERGLCSVLKAMRLMNLKSDNVIKAVVDEILSDRIFENLHERGLCSLLVSLSKLGVSDETVYFEICERLTGKDYLRFLRPREVAEIFDSLYWAECSPPECLESVMEIIRNGDFVRVCSEAEIVTMVRAFRGLGISDKTAIEVLFGEILKPERYSKLNGKQMAVLLEGFVDLCSEEVGPMQQMLVDNMPILERSPTFHVVQIVTRLCQLGADFHEATVGIVHSLSSPENLDRISDACLTTLLDQLVLVGLPGIEVFKEERQKRKGSKTPAKPRQDQDVDSGLGGVLVVHNEESISNVA